MNYKKLVEQALQRAKGGNNILSESMSYPEGFKERMHPQLERELKSQKHSLGKHPIFPDGGTCSFEESIMVERFTEVANRYKRTHDLEDIDNTDVMKSMMPIVSDVMNIEHPERKALEELAIKMIREEYDMDEDVVEIKASLTADIKLDGTQKRATPSSVNDIEFESSSDIVEANEEVYKRRFINAMIQGAAKKCNQMFHMVEDELSMINPKLPNLYSKMMAKADIMYYILPKMDEQISGGKVQVEFPSKKNPKAVIIAEAMVFPVLIHELVKGVMELLAGHGLPKDKEVAKFVIDRADFLAAEPWDMRLGPALWERFTTCLEVEDFPFKHHIFSELVALPVGEFNLVMKEIMAGTKAGKKAVKEIATDVKHGIHDDDFNDAMGTLGENKNDEDLGGFGWDEIGPELN